MRPIPPHGTSAAAWLAVLAWVAFIYSAVPFARRIQAWVDRVWGRPFFLWFVLCFIVLAGGGALMLLVRHHRRIPWKRATGLTVIAVFFGWQTWQMRGVPEEALHFIQYGVLAGLVFFALGPKNRDGWAWMPAACAIVALAGTVDEVIQWLTPGRYFDFRDIGFNLLGGALILAAMGAGFLPFEWPGRPAPSAVRAFCGWSAALVVVLAACLLNTPVRVNLYASAIPSLDYLRYKESAMSEYGWRHVLPGVGVFYSRFSMEELRAVDAARAPEAARILNEWHDARKYGEFLRTHTPATDPFVHEARVHIYRRDHYMAVAGKHVENPASFLLHNTVAFRENQILETAFSQTLYRSRYRLKPAQLEALREHLDETLSYASPVSAGLITRITERQVLWLFLAVLVALGLVALRWGREERS